MSQHDTLTLEQLDTHLDAILRAAGSALRHYTMQKSLDDMRAAMRAALSATQPAHGIALVPESTLTPLQRTYLAQTQPAPAAQSEPVKPLFSSNIAARKWAELQDDGARMQSIAFDGHKCGQPGTIDPWGVVRWGQAAQGEPVRHVGDSKFESWFSEYDPKHKGTKQQMRDAYAAGMSDPVTRPAVAQGAGEVVAELKRLASVCPELNLNNYGPDDVDELNAWAVEVAQAIDQLSDTQPAAGADVPDMVEIMALADSYRNATCQEATASAREWLRAAIAASGRQE